MDICSLLQINDLFYKTRYPPTGVLVPRPSLFTWPRGSGYENTYRPFIYIGKYTLTGSVIAVEYIYNSFFFCGYIYIANTTQTQQLRK